MSPLAVANRTEAGIINEAAVQQNKKKENTKLQTADKSLSENQRHRRAGPCFLLPSLLLLLLLLLLLYQRLFLLLPSRSSYTRGVCAIFPLSHNQLLTHDDTTSSHLSQAQQNLIFRFIIIVSRARQKTAPVSRAIHPGYRCAPNRQGSFIHIHAQLICAH